MRPTHKSSVVWLGALIGCVSFLLVYGITPLQVTNDAWILQGYDELDIVQHYAGWLHYRNSGWAFPLMMAETLGQPAGTIVSFTDSIPWVSLLFKLCSPVLPQTFQFFGWFTLICYALQGAFSAALLALFLFDTKVILCGVPLFTFAPILMDRAFRHTALGAQWMILAALWLYFWRRKTGGRHVPLYFGLLCVLAIGIHPYFLPMLYGLAFFTMLETIRDMPKRTAANVGRQIVALALNLGCTVTAGFCLGTLGQYSALRDGYGVYSMNLNALFNPVSAGGYTWSLFLKQQNQLGGQYDGFNYLGLGLLGGVVVCLALALLRGTPKRLKDFLQRNGLLLVLCVLFSVFAVSHVVSFNSFSVSIPLPEWIVNMCGMFRASSRMFYPVYYLIALWVVVTLARSAPLRRAWVAVALLLAVQLVDLSVVIVGKHLHFLNPPVKILLDDPVLVQAGQNYDTLCGLLCPNDFVLAAYAGKHGMTTNIVAANTGDFAAAFGTGVQSHNDILQGKYQPDTLYVTSDEAAMAELKQYLQNKPELMMYQTGQYLFVLPQG